MSDEILQRLDLLAAKLGVAAEHLYAVLVRQAYVEGVKGILVGVVAGAVIYVWSRFVRHVFQNWERFRADDAHEAWGGGLVLTGIVLFIATLVAGEYVFATVGYLLNPEYFAIQKILGALK